MSLYEQWLKLAYDQQGNTKKNIWTKYLPLEQAIYEHMLAHKQAAISGTIAELAEAAGMSCEFYLGFLDGVNGALSMALDVHSLTPESSIDIELESFERLFKKMVEFKADHLVALKEWDGHFTKEERDIFYKEQKSSGTVVRGEKTGRNDPCPCGSGKKFKKCCAQAA